ncbi:MAG: GtrA family protein [Candidatus Competibacteraceae bacterium]|nr:GtrA family protein [Candidatus Competibacteraceae bacterium]
MCGVRGISILVVQAINLILTSAIVHFMMGRFALPTYTGVIVAFIAAPIISFILFEVWVYRQRQNTSTFYKAPSKSSSHQ